MLSLVIGGAASGKSEYAESLAINYRIDRRIYLATMIPYDEECTARIARHREMRKEKGFQTVECYHSLFDVTIPKGSVVLLECLSNLVANEMYAPNGARENTKEAIVLGVNRICKNAEHVIIVSNDVFSSGELYESETMKYCKMLSAVNRDIAEMSDKVIEVVCSMPIIHKEKGRQSICG
ncbi:MAG: bifunctional adenosylcobinamide kinase/adenosylcobinamide-phosphate guanylyltransferase [Clostridiales bacterium]|nr:bifunctional adenosylcobinamide kinase/adenosylcobinamide-phosphate guanylyltransferase [Clostridiales bacterium]